MSGAELTGDGCSVGDSRKLLSLQASTAGGGDHGKFYVHTQVFSTQSTHVAEVNQPYVLTDAVNEPSEGV